MSSSVAALEALRAVLDPAASKAYWGALAKFVRLEHHSKAEFSSVAVEALGPHIGLHNAFMQALLRDSMCATSTTFKTETGEQTGPAPLAPIRELLQLDEEAASLKRSRAAMEASASAPSSSSAPAGAPSPPKLMLKIGRTSDGGLAASSEKSELKVDPEEEEQLNALHARLLEVAAQNGVGAVAPQAVALLAKAVRAQAHRQLASAIASVGPPADEGARRPDASASASRGSADEAGGAGARPTTGGMRPAAGPVTRHLRGEDLRQSQSGRAPMWGAWKGVP
jgi:hypothetical protein